MKDLILFLQSKGFETFGDWEEHWCQTFSKKVDCVEFIYRLIINDDNTIIFQADVVKNRDRWSNCEYESKFKNKEDFKENWFRYFEYYGM